MVAPEGAYRLSKAFSRLTVIRTLPTKGYGTDTLQARTGTQPLISQDSLLKVGH